MPLRSMDDVSRRVCTRRVPSRASIIRSWFPPEPRRRSPACRPDVTPDGGAPVASLSAPPEPSAGCQNRPCSRPRCEKNTRRCPSWRPHRSEVSRGIERELSERPACEIPHPDVVLLVLNGHRHSRPVRRHARMEVGARRRPQRLLPALSIHPDQRARRRRQAPGASTYASVPSAATSKSAAPCGCHHQSRQHRHRRPTRPPAE